METIIQITTRMIFYTVIMLTVSVCVVAQQNTVSIVQSGSSNLEFDKPSEAGNPVLEVSNDNNWLNYNIAVTSGKKHAIMVQLESALPNGLQLKLVAGTFQGTWGGNVNAPNRRGTNYTDDPAGDSPGIPAAPVTLSLIPQPLVTNIGRFNTGSGIYFGHKLTYTMGIADYSTVRAISSDVNVIYTISEMP